MVRAQELSGTRLDYSSGAMQQFWRNFLCTRIFLQGLWDHWSGRETDGKGMDFIVLDVDMSCSDPASICRIGWANVRNGEIVEADSFPVRSLKPFDPQLAALHGMSKESVSGCVTYAMAKQRIMGLLDGMTVLTCGTFERRAMAKAYGTKSAVPFGGWKRWEDIRSFLPDCAAEIRRDAGDSGHAARLAGLVIETALDSGRPFEEFLNGACGTVRHRQPSPPPAIPSPYDGLSITGRTAAFDSASICFTGKLHISRNRAAQLVKERGGEVKGRMESGITHLVCGAMESPPAALDGRSGKLLKAERLRGKTGKPLILSESAFLDMLKDRIPPSGAGLSGRNPSGQGFSGQRVPESAQTGGTVWQPEFPGLDFLSIDVETANSDRSSICQIGWTHVRDGFIAETGSVLLDPQVDFAPINVKIHGITAEKTRGAPVFRDIKPRLVRMLRGQTVFSYSGFDPDALSKACGVDIYERFAKWNIWLDASDLVRDAWPDLFGRRWSLSLVADRLGLSFDHHDAGSDSQVTARIIIAALRHTGLSLQDWIDRAGSDEYSSPRRRRPPLRDPECISAPSSPYDRISAGPVHALAGKRICFTGSLLVRRTEAAAVAEAAGAVCMKSVTKKTDILVTGEQDSPMLKQKGISSKMTKASDMRQKGHHIQTLTESEFLSLLTA